MGGPIDGFEEMGGSFDIEDRLERLEDLAHVDPKTALRMAYMLGVEEAEEAMVIDVGVDTGFAGRIRQTVDEVRIDVHSPEVIHG